MTLNEALDRIKSLERSWARCEELCLERYNRIIKLEAQIDRMYELQAQHTESNGMLAQERDQAKVALKALLDHYTRLVNSGDCGNWNPETDEVVIAARRILR